MNTITADQMATHIQNGTATPWTHPLGGLIPTAALLNGQWYIVRTGEHDYQPAPQALVDTLHRTHAALTLAHTAAAAARMAEPS